MATVKYLDFRRYEERRIKVNDSMMTLLAGSQLASHTFNSQRDRRTFLLNFSGCLTYQEIQFEIGSGPRDFTWSGDLPGRYGGTLRFGAS
jgi:hypothetical protein